MPSPPHAASLAYRPDIDGLRAVAVLAVVVYHFAPMLVPGGFVGVDVFFVVSGYLITAISARRMRAGGFGFLDFYARRARRLLPALTLVLLTSVVVGELVYGDRAQAAVGQSALAAALFAANLHFYSALDYFQASIETQPLLHLWSLGVEEQFYLVAPVGLVLLIRRPRLLWWSAVSGVTVSFLGSVWATESMPRAAFFLPVFRAWELGLGALLALRPWSPRSPPARTALSVAGIAAVVGSAFALDEHTPFPGATALPATLGTLALLAAGPQTPTGQLLSVAPMRAVGRWSYAWYLWHWPALVFVTFLLARHPSLLEALGLGLATLALSTASTEWLEAPIRTWRVGQPGASVRAGLLVSVGLAALGAATWFTRDPGDTAVTQARFDALIAQPEPDCDAFVTNGLQVLVCAIGTPEPPIDLVVLGDSHAATLATPLRRLAMERGQTGLDITRNDCPPLFDVERGDLPPEQSCHAHSTMVLDALAELEPRRVVLSARWPLYVEQSRVGDADRAIPRLIRAGSRDRDADLPVALTRTVQRLQDSGAEIILVGSIPEVAFHVPREQQRRAQVGQALPPGPETAVFEDRRARSKEMLETVATRTGTRVVQPSDALCGPDHCAIVATDGTPLYFDDNHLSKRGAERIEDTLLPIVE